MASYKLGSKGDEVRRIQGRLAELGLYRGPIDGDFGGGTETAVKAFQKANGLEVDGSVGPNTWKALFAEKIQKPDILSKPVDYRCLALTGSFKTNAAPPECFAGLSGDFDGQGMSFGVLQWNFGQGTLQTLLKEMINEHPEVIQGIFHDNYKALTDALSADKASLISFARSIQHPVKHFVFEPWKGMFKALGRTAEFQDIERRHARGLYQAALSLCDEYGLWSERAAALMFDIKVQNGSIGSGTKATIMNEIAALSKNLPEDELEVQKMRIIANRRAEAANSRWIEDVRARKLCCANGRGAVHGVGYDLEEQFGLRLARR